MTNNTCRAATIRISNHRKNRSVLDAAFDITYWPRHLSEPPGYSWRIALEFDCRLERSRENIVSFTGVERKNSQQASVLILIRPRRLRLCESLVFCIVIELP